VEELRSRELNARTGFERRDTRPAHGPLTAQLRKIDERSANVYENKGLGKEALGWRRRCLRTFAMRRRRSAVRLCRSLWPVPSGHRKPHPSGYVSTRNGWLKAEG
jgi:hypothetical protein